MSKSRFVLYDGRAMTGEPTDDCAVLDTASSESEARREGAKHSQGYGIWAEYDVRGEELINERLRWDLPPAI